MADHIGRFVNDAEMTKARRISLRDDADYDDLVFLTSVVPAMVEEIRKSRAAALTDEELDALRRLASSATARINFGKTALAALDKIVGPISSHATTEGE